MKRFYMLFVWAFLVIAPLKTSASEFFLKISRFGNYKVQFADQMAMTPSNTFRFFDLNPGTYTLSVMDAVSGFMYYQVNITLIYGYRTVGEIDAFGIYRSITSFPVNYSTWYQEANTGIIYPNNPFPNNPYPNNPFPNNPYNPGNFQGSAMSQQSYNELKASVSQKSWDSDRLAILNQALNTNYFTADQVLGLAQLFTWDSDRLTYAKSAYNSCVDKNNYFKVFQAFKWSSDIDALQRYIDGQP